MKTYINFNYKQMKYGYERKREILAEGKYKNYQFYVMNLGTHPTAYVEIPQSSKLFKKDYDDIYDFVDINVHGGLTYSDDNLSISETKIVSGWFIGWDYAHYGDFYGYDLHPKNISLGLTVGGKKWSTEEILEDVMNCIEQIIDYERNLIIKEHLKEGNYEYI